MKALRCSAVVHGTAERILVPAEAALRHGAGVETETRSSREAYAPFGRRLIPGPPASWDGLRWALR